MPWPNENMYSRIHILYLNCIQIFLNRICRIFTNNIFFFSYCKIKKKNNKIEYSLYQIYTEKVKLHNYVFLYSDIHINSLKIYEKLNF